MFNLFMNNIVDTYTICIDRQICKHMQTDKQIGINVQFKTTLKRCTTQQIVSEINVTDLNFFTILAGIVHLYGRRPAAKMWRNTGPHSTVACSMSPSWQLSVSYCFVWLALPCRRQHMANWAQP